MIPKSDYEPYIPNVGETCPALADEEYDSLMEDDCIMHCICLVTGDDMGAI